MLRVSSREKTRGKTQSTLWWSMPSFSEDADAYPRIFLPRSVLSSYASATGEPLDPAGKSTLKCFSNV